MNTPVRISRRSFCRTAAGAVLTAAAGSVAPQAVCAPRSFRLDYILASSLYGKMPLDVILAEVRKTGAETIDIWPEPHGNQREQVEEMGPDALRELLEKHQVRLGMYSCYNPGLFASRPWMQTVRDLGGSMIVAASGGPRGLEGDELSRAVRDLAERLKPLVAFAEETGVRIAVENHSGSLINSPDSQMRLLEEIQSSYLGIALAPYHLPQDPERLASLIHKLGQRLVHFYAWEHGHGSSGKMPKVLEKKQLPGYGTLDFRPLLGALKEIDYQGWTSIFMHPVPRGIPILPTAPEVTSAINRSREYLDHCLEPV